MYQRWLCGRAGCVRGVVVCKRWMLGWVRMNVTNAYIDICRGVYITVQVLNMDVLRPYLNI